MGYPRFLDELINFLKKLPGVGGKTAERLALSLIELRSDELEDVSSLIKKIPTSLHRCKICGHLSDEEICSICSSSSREKNTICVVEDYKSVFMFERVGSYKGVYHILEGLISPIDGVTPDDINITSLIDRIKSSDGDIEIIVALKPSIEGETTTLYINKILEKYNVKVSRLSYGIPMGVEIDYLDSLTLERALKDRKEVA